MLIWAQYGRKYERKYEREYGHEDELRTGGKICVRQGPVVKILIRAPNPPSTPHTTSLHPPYSPVQRLINGKI
jgi:hypothetical protein